VSSAITPQGDVGYIDGLLVGPLDLLDDNVSQISADGEVLATLLGAYDALPMINPTQVSAVVAGGHVTTTVGGTLQWLVVQGIMCDYIPQQVFSQSPPDATDPRVDILCVKYTVQPTDGVMRVFQEPDGTDGSAEIFINRPGVTWEYVEGTPGSGQPSTPSGFELFAILDVAANATTVTPVIQFLTPQQLITGEDHNPVDTVNGLFGDVTLVGGTDIGVVVSGQDITISLTATIVNSVNGEAGAITIVAGTGINVGTSGTAITISNTQTATTVNGLSGAVIIAAGTGISVGTAGSTITITSTVTDTTVNGVGGAVTIAGGGLVTVGTAGSIITLTVVAVSSLNGLAGGVNLTSTGGTIAITPSGSSINLEAVSGGTVGDASTVMSQAGIVQCLKATDYGTNNPALLSSGAASSYVLGTNLGQCAFSGVVNDGGGSTLEIHFKLVVKTGAGAQTIGGIVSTNAGATLIALDGTAFFTSGNTDAFLVWSCSIPDDGATHTLIIHVNKTNNAVVLNAECGPFLPANAAGGLDATKFSFAGEGF
jgi:hypothetical protein